MVSPRLVVAALVFLREPSLFLAFTARTQIALLGVGQLQHLHFAPLQEKRVGAEADVLTNGVVELVDEDSQDPRFSTERASTQATAPFLSQGEIDPEALNPDLSDPKQARVIIYIILSLLPVLFLIPLMLGSRELIPLEAVPPVQL